MRVNAVETQRILPTNQDNTQTYPDRNTPYFIHQSIHPSAFCRPIISGGDPAAFPSNAPQPFREKYDTSLFPPNSLVFVGQDENLTRGKLNSPRKQKNARKKDKTRNKKASTKRRKKQTKTRTSLKRDLHYQLVEGSKYFICLPGKDEVSFLLY